MNGALPDWIDRLGLVGIPFRSKGRDRAGIDCWGLFRLVQAERFGRVLPSWTEAYADACDRDDIARLIAGHIGPWRPLEAGLEGPGDGVLIRFMGRACHVACVVAPGWMLHIEEGVDSACERYDGIKWRPRVAGFHRYQGEPA